MCFKGTFNPISPTWIKTFFDNSGSSYIRQHFNTYAVSKNTNLCLQTEAGTGTVLLPDLRRFENHAAMSVVYAGYGDVSWNNPSMATPNLEKMARWGGPFFHPRYWSFLHIEKEILQKKIHGQIAVIYNSPSTNFLDEILRICISSFQIRSSDLFSPYVLRREF